MSEMTAGRELDALVASRVMGWTEVRYVHGLFAGGRKWEGAYGKPPSGVEETIPGYSTDMAAWQVVERMRTLGWSLRFGNNGSCSQQNAAAFFRDFRGPGRHLLTGSHAVADGAEGSADSAPLAICRAALKACGMEAK